MNKDNYNRDFVFAVTGKMLKFVYKREKRL